MQYSFHLSPSMYEMCTAESSGFASQETQIRSSAAHPWHTPAKNSTLVEAPPFAFGHVPPQDRRLFINVPGVLAVPEPLWGPTECSVLPLHILFLLCKSWKRLRNRRGIRRLGGCRSIFHCFHCNPQVAMFASSFVWLKILLPIAVS